MRVSTISHVWTRTIIHYHQPRLAQWKWLPYCHGPFKNSKAIIWTNIRTTVTLKARMREKRRKLKKMEWLQNYPALLMPVANRYEHINPARSSGHLMKRSEHRNFNAVTTTASGLWCCFWIAHGYLDGRSRLFYLKLYTLHSVKGILGDTGNYLLLFGNWKTTPKTTRGCGIPH